MIIKQSKVKIIDNSGALVGQCIHVYGKGRGSIGDEILVAVKKVRRMRSTFTKGTAKSARILKGATFPALIVWTKKAYRIDDGASLAFSENAVVLLKKRGGDPLGSRILGTIPHVCNNKKVVALSKRVVF
jgi:large subunit ribosomal protein L14